MAEKWKFLTVTTREEGEAKAREEDRGGM